jgi:hypothetical protein
MHRLHRKPVEIPAVIPKGQKDWDAAAFYYVFRVMAHTATAFLQNRARSLAGEQ